ncbi:uncharacterized protein TRIREDRAFT_104343 [Trichoderma reesei QM6a]|uniref:Predicted protein n=1 Tax=Hypocrea jecorina (strain QM6a) TaxID=431241 RepID=G0RC48_HYPJQ|nr:uncharacterized protein TRIREDRAFT_104343 [Trichoderma reesei QM6a]EGR51164.1 predicted protein [Trichoderma reesei QM6a]
MAKCRNWPYLITSVIDFIRLKAAVTIIFFSIIKFYITINIFINKLLTITLVNKRANIKLIILLFTFRLNKIKKINICFLLKALKSF